MALALSGGTVQAVTAGYDLNGNGTQESSASSTVTNSFPGVCAPCTITHSIYNGISDATYTFAWTGPGFTGTVGPTKTVSTTFTTYNSVVSDSGNVAWSAGVAGPADYYKPVTSAVVYYAGELISTLFRSPDNISFKSQVEQVGAASFRYTYTATNFTAASAPFEWLAAGMSGILSANASSVRTLVSGAPAVENAGAASFELSALMAESSAGSPVFTSPQAFLMTANALVPVPEPGQLAMMMAGLALIGAVVRRRSR